MLKLKIYVYYILFRFLYILGYFMVVIFFLRYRDYMGVCVEVIGGLGVGR